MQKDGNLKIDDFKQIDWSKGQVVGLSNDGRYPHPFIITKIDDIVEGFSDDPRSINLLFQGNEGMGFFSLRYESNLLALYNPIKTSEFILPYVNYYSKKKPFKSNYLVTDIMIGNDDIKDFMKGSPVISYYANLLRENKLNIQRSSFGEFIEKMGLDILLKPEIRFKR